MSSTIWNHVTIEHFDRDTFEFTLPGDFGKQKVYSRLRTDSYGIRHWNPEVIPGNLKQSALERVLERPA